MEIFIIILISVLIGLFVIDILLGFISSVLDSKKQVEIEQRLISIETLLSGGVDGCQAIGFGMGDNDAYIGR